MLLRFRNPIVGLLLLCGLIGCGPGSSSKAKSGATHFHDVGTAGESRPQLLDSEREYNELVTYQVPEIVSEREGTPKIQSAESEPEIKVTNAHMKIDPKSQSVTLKFDVSSARGEETIDLKGYFDKSASPWKANLYSTDQKTLEERRVQAVFLCLTAYECNVVAINIHYQVIKGKKPATVQITEGVSGPRVAMSGDGIEEPPAPAQEEAAPDPDYVPSTSEGPLPPSLNPSEPLPPRLNPPDKTEPDSQLPDAKEPDTSPLPTGPISVPPPDEKPAKVIEAKPIPISAVPKEKLKDTTFEIPGRLPVELPEDGPYRVEGLPKPTPDPVSQTTRDIMQSFYLHDGGYLRNADYLPLQGSGFIRRAALQDPSVTQETDRSLAWGNHRMTEFITQAGEEFSKLEPDSRIVLNAVSAKSGGKIQGQLSHQTGLDVDLRYISKRNDGIGFVAARGGRVTSDFDATRNWNMMKSLCGARKEWIIVIFVDEAVKQSMCQQARQVGEAVNDPNSMAYQCLRSLRHWDGHADHAHVRLYCPKDSPKCTDTYVSFPNQTGCNFK